MRHGGARDAAARGPRRRRGLGELCNSAVGSASELPGLSELPNQATAGDPAALRIAEAIARGDRRAEDEFARRYAPGLVTVLRVRCHDPELCKDVAQEALRVVLLRLRAGKVDQPEALGGFLRGTALNLLANELRRSERRLADSAGDWLDELVGESTDPYDTVESEDLVQTMRRVIGGMKVERDRELLWRFYVDDEPKDRLCARFDLSPEHFDRVLHRARLRLKNLWQGQDRAPSGDAGD